MHSPFDNVVEHLLSGGFQLEESVSLLERHLIRKALDRSGGNRCEAARLLGIHRNTLQRKMAEHGLPEAVRRKSPARNRAGTRRKSA